jgi:hypothetical protein
MNNLRQKQGLLDLINTKRSHMILKFSLNLNGMGRPTVGLTVRAPEGELEGESSVLQENLLKCTLFITNVTSPDLGWNRDCRGAKT